MLGPGDWRCLHRTQGRDSLPCCVGCGQERPKETTSLGSALHRRSPPPLGAEPRMEPGGLGAGSALARPRGQLSAPRAQVHVSLEVWLGWREGPRRVAGAAPQGEPCPPGPALPGKPQGKVKRRGFFFSFRFFCFKDLPASFLLRLFRVSWPVLPPGDLMRLLGRSSFKSRSRFKAL